MWLFTPIYDDTTPLEQEWREWVGKFGARTMDLDPQRHDEPLRLGQPPAPDALHPHSPHCSKTSSATPPRSPRSAAAPSARPPASEPAPSACGATSAMTNTQPIADTLHALEQRLAHVRENLRTPELRDEFARANKFRQRHAEKPVKKTPTPDHCRLIPPRIRVPHSWGLTNRWGPPQKIRRPRRTAPFMRLHRMGGVRRTPGAPFMRLHRMGGVRRTPGAPFMRPSSHGWGPQDTGCPIHAASSHGWGSARPSHPQLNPQGTTEGHTFRYAKEKASAQRTPLCPERSRMGPPLAIPQTSLLSCHHAKTPPSPPC